MSKKFIRLMALIISVAMVATLAVGCGGNGDDNQGGGQGASSDIEFLVDPADYKGTTVTYVTWRDPAKNEDGVAIKRFEEKYGIKVAVQLVNETQYVNEITATIISGKQGDIFFQTNNFPGFLTVCQPLDAAKLNYDDPIWNQNTFKYSTIDGHPYLADTVSNVWAECDLVVYNKSLFNDAGITTPAEYYEAGNWTFETFRKAAREITNYWGKGYIGAAVLSDAMLGAAGCAVFKYQDNTFSSGVDTKLIDVMTFMAGMYDEGSLKVSRFGFNEGNVGMAITQGFGLKKTGFFPDINPDHLGVTFLPVWKQGDENKASGIFRAWGLIDGAPNPEAAGIFLREYLDVNNYDIEDTFLNDEAASMFFQVTGLQQTTDMTYYFSTDMTHLSTDPTYFEDPATIGGASKVKQFFESQQNVIANLCTKANDVVAKEREALAK